MEGSNVDRWAGTVHLPTETAIPATQGALGVDSNNDNEGSFVVRRTTYQRYRPAILRTGPRTNPGFCRIAICAASSEFRAVTTTEMG
jgi:hypothetical protein